MGTTESLPEDRKANSSQKDSLSIDGVAGGAATAACGRRNVSEGVGQHRGPSRRVTVTSSTSSDADEAAKEDVIGRRDRRCSRAMHQQQQPRSSRKTITPQGAKPVESDSSKYAAACFLLVLRCSASF